MPRKFALPLLVILCAAALAACLCIPRTRTVTSSCQAFLQTPMTEIILRPTVDYAASTTLTGEEFQVWTDYFRAVQLTYVKKYRQGQMNGGVPTLTLTTAHETRTLQILSTDGTPEIALNGAVFTLSGPHPLPNIPQHLYNTPIMRRGRRWAREPLPYAPQGMRRAGRTGSSAPTK